MPQGLERGRKSRPAQIEDGEQSAHDGGGPGNDDSGDDTHLAIRIALADGIRAGPDFDHAPKEAKHEENAEGGAETLLELAGGITARGLGEDWCQADHGFSREGRE